MDWRRFRFFVTTGLVAILGGVAGHIFHKRALFGLVIAGFLGYAIGRIHRRLES
jgi:hypothetical protein